MLKNRTGFLLCVLTVLAGQMVRGQHLVGYWHNWNDASAPYVPLDQIDPRYDVVNVSFAVPTVGTYHDLQFVPDQVSPSVFEAQVQALRNEGRQVNISIGGATAPIVLSSSNERDVFVSSLLSIIGTYGFNGLDIDLEGSSLMVSGGSIAQPTDQSILLLIEAIGQVMDGYRALAGQKLYLSMAPETAFVQGGMSAYGSIWGAYLPVIHALRDSIDLLHVQLYNSGSMYGIDGGIYTQGTADFIVSQTDAVIQGFSTAGGPFAGLPAHKVAVGLPACNLAAGGGYTDPATVAQAVRYLMGSGPQPGTYQLAQNGGHPALGGLMTWSINWDAVATCDGAYSFAQIFEDVWGNVTSTAPRPASVSLSPWPNPATEVLHLSPQDARMPIDLIDPLGQIFSTMPQTDGTVRVGHLPRGMYQLRVAGGRWHRVVLQ
jgi:chitinase